MCEGIFFILGAGASVDSGLPTYRGPEGLYNSGSINPSEILSCYSSLEKIWEFLRPLYQQIKESSPGSTYQVLQTLAKQHPNSFILTQNIDGHALSCGAPVIEIHGSSKTMSCLKCKTVHKVDLKSNRCSCSGYCRPDIVFFDEDLPEQKKQQIYKLIKGRLSQVVVIGTSLQFPYLREFITKAKVRGAKVLHINPNPEYQVEVLKNEIWLQLSAEEGLKCLL